MRTFFKYLGLVGLGLLLGLLSVAGVLRFGVQSMWVHNGPWRTSLTTGSSKANMYTRATVSVGGLFALNKSEAVYFIADRDSNNQALRSHCSYRIQGGVIEARWWSITLYGSDFFLIPNDANRYSFTMRELQSLPQPKKATSQPAKPAKPEKKPAQWSFVLGPKRPQGTKPQHDKGWIPTGSKKGSQLYLNLRLYHPKAAVVKALKTTPLPTITRLGCEGGKKR
ncbi:MAG: DUF1214 domain-containing protein [Deltaproteobacteria bacterium]|nr:MAG: DUF1214 domain-containing protein [Deltaproteobacteria bacterium]